MLAVEPAVDPAAVQTLKRMTDFLDGLKQFSVNTQIIVEEMHFSGHRVDYDLSAIATVRRPNKLRAVRNLALGTDGIGSDMFEELKFVAYRLPEPSKHMPVS